MGKWSAVRRENFILSESKKRWKIDKWKFYGKPIKILIDGKELDCLEFPTEFYANNFTLNHKHYKIVNTGLKVYVAKSENNEIEKSEINENASQEIENQKIVDRVKEIISIKLKDGESKKNLLEMIDNARDRFSKNEYIRKKLRDFKDDFKNLKLKNRKDIF